VGVALLRPVILALGLVKILELSRSQTLRIP